MPSHHKVELFPLKEEKKVLSSCVSLQVPEDEESIPPVLEYNNHMVHKHQDM